MNVNGASSAYTYLPISSAAKTSTTKPAENTDTPKALSSSLAKKDAVLISPSGLLAAQQPGEPRSVDHASQTAEVVPDEAHAVPLWQAGFYHDITNEWALGTAGNYVDPKNAAYSAGSHTDQQEYAALLQTHVHDLYKNHGLSDAGERYKALKSVPGLNEKLQQEFSQSVKADSQMLSLMAKLGINVS